MLRRQVINKVLAANALARRLAVAQTFDDGQRRCRQRT